MKWAGTHLDPGMRSIWVKTGSEEAGRKKERKQRQEGQTETESGNKMDSTGWDGAVTWAYF